MEANTAQVETSKNGASFAPALDLRSTYLKDNRRHRFPRPGHASLNTVSPMSISLSPPLRAAARSVYRDLWRASATTFAGTVVHF